MSADTTTPAQDRTAFRLMLEVVATTRDESAQAAWVGAVERKMNLVGVSLLKDYVRMMMVVNAKLEKVEHRQMHATTLQQMLDEACHMLFGPVGWVEGPNGWYDASAESNVVADVVGSMEADVVESEGMRKVD
jgi:hypothetical protein